MRGLKTHTKLALVVRREGDGLRSYAHIGTGNYHVKTARLYTDFGLFTCDPVLTRDVVNLFHHLTGYSRAPRFEKLLVAPLNMRSRFIDLIGREAANAQAGRPSRIVAKLNQLEDQRICEALCGLEMDVEAGRIVQIRPNKTHVATEGFACVKGLKQHRMYDSPDRFRYPLRRVGRKFERISWRQALLSETSTRHTRGSTRNGVESSDGSSPFMPMPTVEVDA